MKNSIFKLAILLLATIACINLKASTTNKYKLDTLSCLEIDGRITNAEEGMNGECLVELISDNEVVASVVLKEGKKRFKFVLNRNNYYAIRVSKVGYLSKLVSVNTEMLESGFGLHSFLFETSLMPETSAQRLNEDIIDFPVAIIHYDYEEEAFSYNKEYTAYIKRELHKSSPKRTHYTPKARYIQVLDATDLASK